VADADLALVLTALACLALRRAGVWLAGGPQREHPAIAWATAVAQATLAAFVALAIAAPAGALAEVPLAGRSAWCRGLPRLGAAAVCLLATGLPPCCPRLLPGM
jgi:hypothetical protein